jgi:hypothetical protein
MKMSFKEAIIIPFETFKKIQGNLPDIWKLHDKDNSLTEKYKLNQQEKTLQKIYRSSPKTSELPKKNFDEWNSEVIVKEIKTEQQPFVKSIIEIIKKHPDQINWNKTFQVAIDNDAIIGSNIIEIFKHLTRTSVVTRTSDIPTGTTQVHKKLLDLGVPSSWIAVKLKATRRRKLPEEMFSFQPNEEKSKPKRRKQVNFSEVYETLESAKEELKSFNSAEKPRKKNLRQSTILDEHTPAEGNNKDWIAFTGEEWS